MALIFAVLTSACSKDESDDSIINKKTSTNNSGDATLTTKTWKVIY